MKLTANNPFPAIMIRWTDRLDGAQIAAGLTRVRAARIGQRPMTTP